MKSQRIRFSPLQWTILIGLALLLCALLPVAGLLLLRLRAAAPATQVGSAGPTAVPATPLSYPTFPPEWTPTPVRPATATPRRPARTATPQATATALAAQGADYRPVALSDLCADPFRYEGDNMVVRGQVIQFDRFNDAGGTYTQVQIGEIYVPGSACLQSSYVMPVVVYYDGTLTTLEPGTAVIVEGYGNGVVPDPSALPWIVADAVRRDPDCNVTLTVRANPRAYIVLDRIREKSAVTGARFTGVCPGPHELASSTLVGAAGALSIDIPEGVTAWEVQYGVTAPGGGSTCFNCP